MSAEPPDPRGPWDHIYGAGIAHGRSSGPWFEIEPSEAHNAPGLEQFVLCVKGDVVYTVGWSGRVEQLGTHAGDISVNLFKKWWQELDQLPWDLEVSHALREGTPKWADLYFDLRD